MGKVQSCTKVLVIGDKAVGKTYFIDHVCYGGPFTYGPTLFTYEMSMYYSKNEEVIFSEYPHSDWEWDVILLVVRADASEEQLLSDRNRLLEEYAKHQSPVVVVHNVFPDAPEKLSFEKRNSLLQIEGLPKVVTFALDYTSKKWKRRADAMFRTIVRANAD